MSCSSLGDQPLDYDEVSNLDTCKWISASDRVHGFSIHGRVWRSLLMKSSLSLLTNDYQTGTKILKMLIVIISTWKRDKQTMNKHERQNDCGAHKIKLCHRLLTPLEQHWPLMHHQAARNLETISHYPKSSIRVCISIKGGFTEIFIIHRIKNI